MPYKDPKAAKRHRREYYRKHRETAIQEAIDWKKANREKVNSNARKKHRQRLRSDDEFRSRRLALSKKYYQQHKQQRISEARSDRVQNELKHSARQLVRNAVRRGEIKKPSKCQSCGVKTRLQAHHDDYTKPLDVVWLCAFCHGVFRQLA